MTNRSRLFSHRGRSLLPAAVLSRAVLLVVLCLSNSPRNGFALGQVQYVENVPHHDDFPIVQGKTAAAVYVDTNDWAGVIRAAGDLQTDVARVTGLTPAITHDGKSLGPNLIIIGTIGRSALIDQLIHEGKIDASPIAGKWESFFIQVVPDPLPGIVSALVIAGSDKRGTIYGIYDLSEEIGVSPWYWWADVAPTRQKVLFVKPGKYVQGPPSVKYRGIFLNDEAPDLSNWITNNFGTIPPGTNPPVPPGVANYNHQFYTKLFELILRLKGNYLWPAMWNNAFNEDDPLNPRLADGYGIVMGTSHQEPMLRAQKEWDRGTTPKTRMFSRISGVKASGETGIMRASSPSACAARMTRRWRKAGRKRTWRCSKKSWTFSGKSSPRK